VEALLVALAVILLSLAVAAAAAVALVVRWLTGLNRVSPDVPSLAPASWVWSPFLAARLHRRLRRCVVAVRATFPRRRRSRRNWPALAEAGDQLSRYAADVDVHLVQAHRAGRVAEVAWEVDEVEHMTARLLSMGRLWAADDLASRRAQDLRDRLDALEGAIAEIHRVDVTRRAR
jgi:hypothetical protein